MVVVVLVATLSSAMMWYQQRGVELEAAKRTRVQSEWILRGAVDWAGAIAEDAARQGGGRHLGEAWAVPLAPARLSTFLSAEKGASLVGENAGNEQDVFLSGSIRDLQDRLNVNNLVQSAKLHQTSHDAWGRLFEHLKLPKDELDRMAGQLLKAHLASTGGDSKAPLIPQSTSDLAWLGLSAKTIEVLTPYVVVLPVRTPVNLNTAPAEVLMASLQEVDIGHARQLVQDRITRPMNSDMDALLLIKNPAVSINPDDHAVSSSFYQVVGRLETNGQVIEARSVLQRANQRMGVVSMRYASASLR